MMLLVYANSWTDTYITIEGEKVYPKLRSIEVWDTVLNRRIPYVLEADVAEGWVLCAREPRPNGLIRMKRSIEIRAV